MFAFRCPRDHAEFSSDRRRSDHRSAPTPSRFAAPPTSPRWGPRWQRAPAAHEHWRRIYSAPRKWPPKISSNATSAPNRPRAAAACPTAPTAASFICRVVSRGIQQRCRVSAVFGRGVALLRPPRSRRPFAICSHALRPMWRAAACRRCSSATREPGPPKGGRYITTSHGRPCPSVSSGRLQPGRLCSSEDLARACSSHSPPSLDYACVLKRTQERNQIRLLLRRQDQPEAAFIKMYDIQ